MNKSPIIALSLVFSILILISSVHADVTQENRIQYATLDINGTQTSTSNEITNANVMGFVCADSNCNTFNGTLWGGSTINSGSSSILNLVYPSTLLSQYGYALYFFKEGYIPFELMTNWSGDGQATGMTRYLAQKTSCTTQLSLNSFSVSNDSVLLDVNVTSPIENAGPLNAIPSQLSSIYSTNIQLNADITGMENISKSRIVNVPFSSVANHTFGFTLPSGNYSISLSASSNDSKCLSLSSNTFSREFSVFVPTNETNQTDTTPPATISNLHLTLKTNSTLSWEWVNPSDLDFKESLIYLDGINVLNTSSTSFSALNLSPSSTRTLTILTSDFSGNVNPLEVSDTQTTLQNPITPPINDTNQTDTTPPATISNLSLDSATNTSLSWSWVNPNDADFFQAIVYLDGVNVLNTSGNGFGYLNFLPNTSHIISVLTMDNSSNINTNAVSRIDSTLANSNPPINPPHHGGGGGSPINHITDLNQTLDVKKHSVILEEEYQNNTILTPVTKQASALTLTWVLLLLGALFLIILIFAALMLTPRSQRKR